MTVDFASGSERPSHTRTQHAIRILVLLDSCGEAVVEGDPARAAKAVRSELRLQAMDFWMRNPDYLADELISQIEGNDLPDSYLSTAQWLLEDPEPDLRWYPMPRWFYGAYEAIDDAVALLETYGLATVRRAGLPGVKSLRNSFFLTSDGQEAVAEIAKDPVLSWYPRQANLVALVARDTIGSRLKSRQYEQATYAGTELGLNIAPIAGRVRERLKKFDALEVNGSAGANLNHSMGEKS